MKKLTKSKKQKIEKDAEHGASKKKALMSKSRSKKEDEGAPTHTAEKAITAEGLNKERAGGDGEDKRKESKIKKTKKRKASPEQEELTLKKKKKKNEKVFDLPGQKRPPPNERDPLRIFYETLYKQVPDCEMAQIWMMESGLLPSEEAMQIYNKKRNKMPCSPAEVVAAEKSRIVHVKPSSPLSSSKKKTSEATVKLKKLKKREAIE